MKVLRSGSYSVLRSCEKGSTGMLSTSITRLTLGSTSDSWCSPKDRPVNLPMPG